MSSTLARLRLIFDDPILVQEGRGMVPTAFAESIVEPLSEALAQIDQVVGSRLALNIELKLFAVSADAIDRLRRHKIDLLIHPLEILRKRNASRPRCTDFDTIALWRSPGPRTGGAPHRPEDGAVPGHRV